MTSNSSAAASASSVDAEAVEAVLEASRALVAVSARSISAAGRVTLPQYRMLVVLDEGEVNLTTLADHLEVAPSTALRMTDRLIAAGLVERSVPPENRRETHLSVTTTGRRLVRAVTARRRRDVAGILSRLTPREQRELLHGMSAFARAADEVWAGEG